MYKIFLNFISIKVNWSNLKIDPFVQNVINIVLCIFIYHRFILLNYESYGEIN